MKRHAAELREMALTGLVRHGGANYVQLNLVPLQYLQLILAANGEVAARGANVGGGEVHGVIPAKAIAVAEGSVV